MTVHGAKGDHYSYYTDTFQNTSILREILLEKNGLVGILPKGSALPDYPKILLDERTNRMREEEQRLFYVAVTRAKQWLILCARAPARK